MGQWDIETYGILREGYDPTPPGGERNRTARLIATFFGGRAFALDFGDGDVRPMCSGPACVHFAPPRFRTLLAILTNPGLRFGEAFMDGKWHLTKGTISEFLLMMVASGRAAMSQYGLSLGISERIVFFYKQFLATFSATREVAHHYDVSPEVFRHIIGKGMVYSAGFFENGITDLEKAQKRKFKLIFDRLGLGSLENPRILDIGCGWGSFERYFPRTKTAEIDGISISEGQIAFARQETDRLSNKGKVKVRFLKEDYRFFCRNNSKSYDRIVSIGMLEHVGKTKYAHFFRSVGEVMAEDGLALIHSIVKHEAGASNLWVDRYIFPGGYVPKISEVVEGIERSGLRLRAIHYHEGMNYILTLRQWLANLIANEEVILGLFAANAAGRPEAQRQAVARASFRMFIYYLSAVQLMFMREWGGNGLGHFVVGR